MSEKIKNNMIPDEIKSICGSCESYIIAQNRGCAFRSLGNEYCDYVLNATKLYLEKDKEIERLQNVLNQIEGALYNENLSNMNCRITIQEILDKENGDGNNKEKPNSGSKN